MALLSNVPEIQFTSTGLIIPTSQQILDGVLEDFREAFSVEGDLSIDLSTPQGQLATSLASIIDNKNSQIAYIVNQFDPRYSSGFFQDAIGEIYFINRKPGTPTSVFVVITGLPGTVIPQGTQCQDTNGNVYEFITNTIIGPGGTTNTEVKNVETGPIPCPANTLNVISQSVIGWDAINNLTDGILGTNIESRRDFENRRINSVALNSAGIIEAIRGRVFSLIEVLDVKVLNNYTKNPIVINGVNLIANSVYVSVYSENWTHTLRELVAQEIFNSMSIGAATNGATTIDVPYSATTQPISFQETDVLNVYYRIEITNNPMLPVSITNDIKKALVAAFSESIGATIDANTYYSVILSTSQFVQIVNGFIGTAPAPVTPTLTTNANQKPLLPFTNIEVIFV